MRVYFSDGTRKTVEATPATTAVDLMDALKKVTQHRLGKHAAEKELVVRRGYIKLSHFGPLYICLKLTEFMSVCQYVSMSACQYVSMSVCQYVGLQRSLFFSLSFTSFIQMSFFLDVQLVESQFRILSLYEYTKTKNDVKERERLLKESDKPWLIMQKPGQETKFVVKPMRLPASSKITLLDHYLDLLARLRPQQR